MTEIIDEALNSISFEHGIVAFLDILGFTKKFEKHENRLSLLKLQVELSRLFNGSASKGQDHECNDSYRTEVTCIADSIIVSMPFDPSDEKEEVFKLLKTFFINLKSIIFKCLSEGMLIRGGVDVGELFHKGTLVSGWAYISAFNLEKNERFPKVVVSENCLETLITHSDKNRINTLSSFCLKKNIDEKLHWFDFLDHYPQGYPFFSSSRPKPSYLTTEAGYCNRKELIDILKQVKSSLETDILKPPEELISEKAKKTTPREKMLWAIDYIADAIAKRDLY